MLGTEDDTPSICRGNLPFVTIPTRSLEIEVSSGVISTCKTGAMQFGGGWGGGGIDVNYLDSTVARHL